MKNATVIGTIVRRLVIALGLGTAAVAVLQAEGTSAAFLKNNMDVRSEAMGGGADAFVTGAASAFRNPAGAAKAGSSELLFSYTQAMLGSSYQGVSYLRAPRTRETERMTVSSRGVKSERSVERGRLAVGVHAIYHQLGSFGTTDANFNETGSVRPYNIAAGVTLARPFGAISTGLTLKAVHQSLGTASADSYAADFGLVAPLPAKGLSLSASVTNLGTKAKFVSESYSLPTAASVGLGFETRFVRLAADYRAPMAGDERGRFAFGTEFVPLAGLALRAGYLNNLGGAASTAGASESAGGLGFGAGLTMGRYGLDYAVVPTAFETASKISLKISF